MSTFTTRPVIQGLHGVVSAGHYLATISGIQVLERGGNAFDAAAAVGFALTVLEPHQNSLGGEVPIVLYSQKEDRVLSFSGQGPAPLAANIEWFRARGIDLIPGDGFLPAVVPSVVGTWIQVLKQLGTMKFRDVAESAIQLAENGFPMYSALNQVIIENSERFQNDWITTGKVFIPGGTIPEEGEIFRQPQLAKTLRLLVEAEEKGANREDGLENVRREFYEGCISSRILSFLDSFESTDSTGTKHKSFLKPEDFSSYKTKIEDTASTSFHEYEVFKCGPWTQGPVFLEQLNILESFDLRTLSHNSVDYLHVLIEAAKLAFADREEYYGDPNFASVPLSMLLSKEHGADLAQRIDMNRASSNEDPRDKMVRADSGGAIKHSSDTTHLDVIDSDGNMISATQSGGWIPSSPIIDELGFALSTRGQMFDLELGRNNSLMPGKRPRITLTPSLAFKNGKPFMVFGTPGGDQQDQWSLQFFLNVACFGMNLQQAIDAPSFHSLHIRSSFYPRDSYPRRVVIESRVPPSVIEELRKRGHEMVVVDGWENGKVCAVARNPETGVIFGASSPKTNYGGIAYTIGW
ncbi:MAG: gamma-glutamyltransferase family protein [Thaumarchaeota archaeon]|nr:gamma-glutamyltransferase family protein [Nitrososphaerota archaeon]